jgi:nitrous oxidase accessory protein NosD
MRSFVRCALLAPLLILCVGVVVSTTPQVCTITVSTSQGLQDAVATLPTGSTICLRPGTYEVNLTVRQSIFLLGAGPAEQVVLQAGGEPDTPVVHLDPYYGQSFFVVLENLTITGASGGEGYGEERGDHGLFVDRNVRLMMRNIVCVDNGGAAVYVEEEAQLTANDCTFGESMYGVLLAGYCAARLSECTIYDNQIGVGLAEGGQLDLSKSTIADNVQFGAVLVGGQAAIDRCDFEGNTWGLIIGAPGRMPAQLQMTNCTVVGSENVGIALLSADCVDPEAPDGATAQVSGEWNDIPGPDDPNGNAAGALCPAESDPMWPEDFLRD